MFARQMSYLSFLFSHMLNIYVESHCVFVNSRRRQRQATALLTSLNKRGNNAVDSDDHIQYMAHILMYIYINMRSCVYCNLIKYNHMCFVVVVASTAQFAATFFLYYTSLLFFARALFLPNIYIFFSFNSIKLIIIMVNIK